MRKAIKIVMSLLLLSFLAVPLTASADASVEPFDTLKKYFDAVNTQHYAKIADTWLNPDEINSFIADKKNEDEMNGFYAIKKAKISDSKILSYELAAQISPYFDRFVEDFKTPIFYYIAVDYTVAKETKYAMNGTNYLLVALVQQNNEWKISQFPVAPVDIIAARGQGFNNDDEKNAQEQFKLRDKGIYVNRKGQSIETNASRHTKKYYEQKQAEGITTMAVDELSKPSVIRVKILSSDNYKLCQVGCLAYVGFDNYTKDVLPNEWGLDSTWKDEALRSGAMAVKMYGWFAVKYPLHDSQGYDVNDGGTSASDPYPDQKYIYGSNSKEGAWRAVNALDYVDGYGMYTGQTHKIFLARYALGEYNDSFGLNSGELKQLGSKYYADHGIDYYGILDRYYSYSQRLNYERMTFFVY